MQQLLSVFCPGNQSRKTTNTKTARRSKIKDNIQRYNFQVIVALFTLSLKTLSSVVP